MTLDDVEEIETLRRAAKILEAEVQTLSKLVLSLKRELHEAKHGKPEQLKLEMQLQELEDQLARRNKLLFGDSSEKRGSTQPKKTSEKKQTGHGRDVPGIFGPSRGLGNALDGRVVGQFVV